MDRDEATIPPVAPDTGAEELTLRGGEWPDVRVAKYMLAKHDENGILEELSGLPTILYRFTPTKAQRKAIAGGEDLYLAVITYGRPPLPLQLQVGPAGFERKSKLLDVTGSNFQMDGGEHQVARIIRPE